jgi:hypothetical protein
MRLKTVRTPDALDRTRTDADCFRHHGGSPVGRLGGRTGLSERNHTCGDIRPKRLNARGSRLIAQEAAVTFLREAFLPALDTGLRLTGLARRLHSTARSRRARHAYAAHCDPVRAPPDGGDARA